MAITLLLCVAVFLSAAAGDIVESYMVRAVVDLNPHRTARMSITMWAIGCISWIIIVKSDQWYVYLVPEVLGLYVGSYIGVSAQRKRQQLPKARALRTRVRCRAQARVSHLSPRGNARLTTSC